MKRKSASRLRIPEWLHLDPGALGGMSEARLSESDKRLIAMLETTYLEAFMDLKDEDEAEDVAADVMLKVLKKLLEIPALIDNQRELEGYRYRRMRTRIYNQRRGGKRAERRKPEIAKYMELERSDHDSVDRLFDEPEYSVAMQEAFAELSPEFQDACYLRHGLEIPPRDIAVIRGVSIAVVKNRISRGMEMLRRKMLPRQTTKELETPRHTRKDLETQS